MRGRKTTLRNITTARHMVVRGEAGGRSRKDERRGGGVE